MRISMWLGVLCAVGVTSALTACGGGDSGTGGAGGSGGSPSSSSTGMGGMSSSTSAGGTGGTGGSGPMVNGCDTTKLTDLTASAAVTIKFGGDVGSLYDPPCIKVKDGTSVTFEGNFMFHPLEAGVPPAMDAASPIKATSTGMTATFSLTPAGSYPYYCNVHQEFGMKGLIVVE